jgi:hypothetical protein
VTVVGTLGEPCDAPGTLACAGNHQKLTVVCGGDGEWETNQTCGATEFCDSVEGDTTGLCLEPEAECEGREPDDTICVDGNVYSCAPDGIRPWLSEICTGFCEDGAKLMGARTIISGMKPEIAMALETMGITLQNVTTTLDLETALDLLGVRRTSRLEQGDEEAATEDLDAFTVVGDNGGSVQ